MLHTLWLVAWLVFITSAVSFGHELRHDPNSYVQQTIGVLTSQKNLSQHELYSLHRSLVNFDCISGNENAVGSFLEAFLQLHNYTVERQCVESKDCSRFNLLAYPGTSRQTRILLSSHIDTVPPFYGYSVDEEDRIWGRGSVDAKACVATQFYALQELIASGEVSAHDASLLFVVGEEIGGDGMIAVNKLSMEWETVIFGEPTELKLASGHKGILIFDLRAHGKAGHSGYPWLGASANHLLIPALAALQTMDLPSSNKYGNSTLNIGRIDGGVAANVIAETAVAKIGIRIAGGDADLVKMQVLEAVKKADPEHNLEVSFYGGAYGPVDLDHDVEGFESITVNYGTDVPNLKGKHRRYLYGPGNILVAHSDHEHLAAEELLVAVEGYKKLILAAVKR